MNSKFCPVPWVSLSTKPNGNIRVCCHANASDGKGYLKNQNGQFHNLKESQIVEARNSQLSCDVRKSMLKNESHEMCKRCDIEDQRGVRSRRQYELKKWKDNFNLDKAFGLTDQNGKIDEGAPLLHLDIRFSNFCNLKCRMCGPTDSSGWYKEFYESVSNKFQDHTEVVQLVKDEASGVVQAQFDPYQWHSNENTWIELVKYIPNIKEYYFAGGEPLLINRHYQLLEKIVELGYADQVAIEYNTNLTKLPDRVLKLWENFKEVRVGVSLDGYKGLNEYIRYPSVWNDIEENIKKLDLAKGNIVAWAACTVQVYNVIGVLDLISWIYACDFKRFGQQSNTPFITPHLLHNPPYFNIRSLPLEKKKIVRSKYDDYFVKMNEKDVRFARVEKVLRGYLDYMDSEDWTNKHWNTFIDENNRMNQYRGQKNIDLL